MLSMLLKMLNVKGASPQKDIAFGYMYQGQQFLQTYDEHQEKYKKF
jgi:hypothetical protein